MPAYPKSRQTRKPSKEDKPPRLKITAEDLLRALLQHWQKYDVSRETTIAMEVGLWGGLSRIDALALRYYDPPIALEVKVSRSDWLNELKDPDKHRPAREFAGQLYFVAPPGIIKPEELPPGTGLYEVKPFTKIARAIVKADRQPPAPITWHQTAQIAVGVLRAAEKGIV